MFWAKEAQTNTSELKKNLLLANDNYVVRATEMGNFMY